MAISRTLRDVFGALPVAPGAPLSPNETLAAVLLPVIDGVDPTIVFTKRTDELPRHAGEISFPGGLSHPEDSFPLDTALRETEEELGLSREAVDVVGSLEPLRTFTTGFMIVPFIGVLEPELEFTPNPREIAEVLEFPISRLMEVEREVNMSSDGATYFGFVYELDGRTIWGATARILHTLLERLQGSS